MAIDMKRDAFVFIVENVIPSAYNNDMQISREEWKEQVKNSDIRCQ